MGWRADQDQDENRLPYGFECIGYDSDLCVYTYRDTTDGSIWASSSGNRYGQLRKVRNAPEVVKSPVAPRTQPAPQPYTTPRPSTPPKPATSSKPLTSLKPREHKPLPKLDFDTLVRQIPSPTRTSPSRKATSVRHQIETARKIEAYDEWHIGRYIFTPVRPRIGTASEIEGYDEWHIGQYIFAPFQSLGRAVTSAYAAMQTSSQSKQKKYPQRTRTVSEPSRLGRSMTQRRKIHSETRKSDDSSDEKPRAVHYDFVDKRGSRYEPQRFCEFEYEYDDKYEDDMEGYTSAEEEEKLARRRERTRVDRLRDRNIDRRRSTRN